MGILDTLDACNPEVLRSEIRRLERELASRPPDFMEVCRALKADHLEVLVDHDRHWLVVARVTETPNGLVRLARAFDYASMDRTNLPKTTVILASFEPDKTIQGEGTFIGECVPG